MAENIDLDRLKAQIALKLAGLGVKANFLRAEFGPIVTTMFYQLFFDVPIGKIMNRSEDIAIACGVEAVLIGRKGGEIFIEIPKANREVINFDNCIFNLFKELATDSLKIPLMLGVDTQGNSYNMDLVDQPHVLVAGSTGGGKSILLSSIIGAIGLTKTPQEVKLILVDTKKLDLPLFQNLPHVIDNIETVDEFQRSMDRLMGIVRKRTDKMKGIARNITEYNRLVDGTQRLPYFVMIIDELADLIDEDKARSASDDDYKEKYLRVPFRIKALVQICRAAGVHIIAATQRSSVKVINGDIKANFPTRIALRLPTRADSTTILSSGGAESLLGKGDMLVESPLFPNLKRLHGAFVTNNDIVKILDNAEDIRRQLKLITSN